MNLRKKLVMAGSIAMSLTVGGVAYAFWTSNATGIGSAKTAAAAPTLTITQTNTIDALAPGDPSVPIDLKLRHPGPGHLRVVRVSVAISDSFSAQADTTKPVCLPTDFAVESATIVHSDLAPSTDYLIPGGPSGSGATIAMKNTGLNQDNCQNVTLPLVFTAVSSL